jgi:cytochrome c6
MNSPSTSFLSWRFAIAVLTAFFFVGTSPAAPPADAGLFKTKCAACHGPDGKAQTGIGKAEKIPDLTSAEVQKQSDYELGSIITNGKGKMPAYGKSLKPDQIKDLVSYIRTLAKP